MLELPAVETLATKCCTCHARNAPDLSRSRAPLRYLKPAVRGCHIRLAEMRLKSVIDARSRRRVEGNDRVVSSIGLRRGRPCASELHERRSLLAVLAAVNCPFLLSTTPEKREGQSFGGVNAGVWPERLCRLRRSLSCFDFQHGMIRAVTPRFGVAVGLRIAPY